MKTLNEKLSVLYSLEAERCGFVLDNKKIIKLKNISPYPDLAFAFDPEEFNKYVDTAMATWHTHTHKDPNLSFDDYQFFLSWPKLKHFIISSDAVWSYEVVNGSVIVHHEA